MSMGTTSSVSTGSTTLPKCNSSRTSMIMTEVHSSTFTILRSLCVVTYLTMKIQTQLTNSSPNYHHHLTLMILRMTSPTNLTTNHNQPLILKTNPFVPFVGSIILIYYLFYTRCDPKIHDVLLASLKID